MSEEVISKEIKSKKKQEKAEDFIGRTFNYGKLKVIGVAGKQGKNTTFKVTCTECSKDPELFPDGYFVAQKFDLINGHKPCGCEFCQQEMKKFSDNPDGYLDEHWKYYLERKNYKPSEEELERHKATLEEYRKKGWLV